jgi:hypothetical protein
LQPSSTPIEFAPEPLQFKLQLLGRCLSAYDRSGVHGPFSIAIRRVVKLLPNFRILLAHV